MTDAFIFFTRSPDAAPRILRKFLRAVLDSGLDLDFHILTYSDGSLEKKEAVCIDGVSVDHWTYGRSSAFSLGYREKVKGSNWAFIPGHCDTVIIKFFQDNSHYQRIWRFEDDIDYSGDCSDLLQKLSKFKEDLICTHLQQGWDNWVYNDFLKTASGDLVKPADTLLAFLPLFIISSRALIALDAAYKAGWSGHYEQTWPTIINGAGYTLRDIGGDGEFVDPKYRNRFYLGGPGHKANKVGTFVPTPPRLRVGWRKNTLYHPVKPLGQWWFGKRRRFKSILNYYKTRIFG